MEWQRLPLGMRNSRAEETRLSGTAHRKRVFDERNTQLWVFTEKREGERRRIREMRSMVKSAVVQ